MYLEREFLSRVLKANGFSGYEKLYVSSEVKKTKHSGHLFSFVINDLGVKPSDLLHIGDNFYADVKQARKNGIKAIYYPKILEQFFAANRTFKRFSHKTKGLDKSIWLSLQAIKWKERDLGLDSMSYWEEIGYFYAGLIGFSYTKWILREARQNGIEHIAFIARDGYLLSRIFDVLQARSLGVDSNGDFNADSRVDSMADSCSDSNASADSNKPITFSYIYAQRLLNMILSLDDTKPCLSFDTPSLHIVRFFANDEKVRALIGERTLTQQLAYEILNTHKSHFIALAATQVRHYKDYLKSHIPTHSKCAVVDSATAHFSSQRLIESMLGIKCYGLYWAINELLNPNREGFSHSAFLQTNHCLNNDFYTFSKNWGLVEFLLSAPESSILGIDSAFMPIYNPINKYENARIEAYRLIERGALRFVEEILARFKGVEVFFCPHICTSALNFLLDNPTSRDYAAFSAIFHASDSAHNNYKPMLGAQLRLKDVVQNPIKSLRQVINYTWKSPPQKLVVTLSKPLLRLRKIARKILRK